jgi:hypothetical protein
MARQGEFYHTFKRLRPSDGTAWDTEKERVLEQAWWEAMVRADEMLEAAEFEQRVAAVFAMMMLCPNDEKYPCRHSMPELGCMRAKTKLTGPMAVHCEDCILREVRLQVEEEMDGK